MRRLLALLCVSALVLSACAGSREVASVDGETISGADFDNELDLISLALAPPDVLNADDVEDPTIPAELTTSQLAQWIDAGLVLEEVERRGIEVTVDDRNGASEYLINGVLGGGDAAVGQARLAELGDGDPLADHLDEWIERFGAQQAMFRTLTDEVNTDLGIDRTDGTEERLVCLWVLVTSDPDGITEAQERLAAGEEYGAVSDDLTEDPTLVESRGDIGCLPESLVIGDLGPMETGQVLDPIQDPSGMIVLYAASDSALPGDANYQDLALRVPPGALDQAEANRTAQTDGAVQTSVDGQFSQLLNGLRADADVSVDPRYGVWSPQDGLLPPARPGG